MATRFARDLPWAVKAMGIAKHRVRAGLPELPQGTAVVLDDYAGLTWSDLAAERGDRIAAAMREFLSRRDISPVRSRRRTPNAAGIPLGSLSQR